MLFKQIHLHGIKAGEISLAFRKWKKPLVNKGTLVKTSIGQIEILDITEVNQEIISHEDAISAGYNELTDLTKILDTRREGNIYKIRVAYHSLDPRIKLRKQTVLSDEEFDQIKLKLERLDKFSRRGKWTLSILQAIRNNPKLKAQDLADKIGKQKDWLKPNIRKLKNLGLTISHEVGYSISPRGKIILEKLAKENTTNEI